MTTPPLAPAQRSRLLPLTMLSRYTPGSSLAFRQEDAEALKAALDRLDALEEEMARREEDPADLLARLRRERRDRLIHLRPVLYRGADFVKWVACTARGEPLTVEEWGSEVDALKAALGEPAP